MTGEFKADLQALLQGGMTIGQVSDEVRALANDLRAAVASYADAGGTGEIGEAWTVNYKPAEEQGLRFLTLLSEVIEEAAGRTRDTGIVFSGTNEDANQVAGNEP